MVALHVHIANSIQIYSRNRSVKMQRPLHACSLEAFDGSRKWETGGSGSRQSDRQRILHPRSCEEIGEIEGKKPSFEFRGKVSKWSPRFGFSSEHEYFSIKLFSSTTHIQSGSMIETAPKKKFQDSRKRVGVTRVTLTKRGTTTATDGDSGWSAIISVGGHDNS